MPLELLLITAAIAIVEVAGIMLLARGILWLFGPKARKGNFFYNLLTTATLPFIRLARKITPRRMPDAYAPAIAFLLIFAVWTGLGLARQAICAGNEAQCLPAPAKTQSFSDPQDSERRRCTA